MFSVSDIIDIAIQIEKNGEKAYRQALEQTSDYHMKGLLAWVADEERRHAEWFDQLKAGVQQDDRNAVMKEMGRELIDNFITGQTFSLEEITFADLTDRHQLIDICIEFEKDTIIFYSMLKTFLHDGPVVDRIEEIIGDEELHVEKLLGLLSGDGEAHGGKPGQTA